MQTIRSIISIIIREYLLTFRNFYDLLIVFKFFLLGILIFIFAIGPDKEIYSKIGIGIIWTLLLFSNNLSINKLFQDDFNDGNLIIYQISGISLELIVIIKMLTTWIFFQLPFLLVLPIACMFLDILPDKIFALMLIFLISSPILTCISSISSSMNLLNNKNFTIGSIIVILFSIPVIVFSVNIINSTKEFFDPQLNILLGILFLFLAITPWISSICIKISIENK